MRDRGEQIMSQKELAARCEELGDKIANTVAGYPEGIVVTTLVGTLGAYCSQYNIPREFIIKLLDEAIGLMKG
jgi:hypoxanthine-guanine phosphoribosyltransferase